MAFILCPSAMEHSERMFYGAGDYSLKGGAQTREVPGSPQLAGDLCEASLLTLELLLP